MTIAVAFVLVGPPSAPKAQQREVTAARGVVQSTVSGSGNLEPSEQRSVSFGTSGTVTAVYVEAGEKVAKGEALALLEEAEQALANTVLRAPASGTIAEVNGAIGDTTGGGSTESESSSQSSESTAGATPTLGGGGGGASSSSTSSEASSSGSGFVTLVRLDRLNLEVTFSESDIGKLKVGQAATVSVNALSDVELAARVTSIGTLPDSSGDVVEYPVTLTLKQMDRRLKPGMTASADVVVSQVERAVSLPSQAISRGPSGATVTVSEDGEQERRSVTTGLEGDTATQIVSGLEPGDRVVIPTSAPGAAAAGAMPGAGGAFPGGGGGMRGGGFPGGAPGGGGFPGGGPP